MFALEHFGLQPGFVPGQIHSRRRSRDHRDRRSCTSKLFKLAHTLLWRNPLACAAANAAIQYIEDFHLAQRAQELGQEFMTKLKRIDSSRIREVRGMGLMVESA
jgi:4-aminobutyrate aminotransferase-like enzyme